MNILEMLVSVILLSAAGALLIFAACLFAGLIIELLRAIFGR